MRLLLIPAILLLSACSNAPGSFILAPQVYWSQSNQLSQSRFAFNVVDSRAMPYTLRILKDGKATQVKTSNDLIGHVQRAVAQALTDHGAMLDDGSGNRLTIQVSQLQALVDQHTLDHSVTNQVALTIQIQHANGTYSKTYSGDGSYTAPFTMDIAAVERELRVLTEQVLTQLLQDDSWHPLLRG